MVQSVQGKFKPFRPWEIDSIQSKKFGMPPASPPITSPSSYRTPPLGEIFGNYPTLARSENYRYSIAQPFQTQIPMLPFIISYFVPSNGQNLYANSVRMQQIGVLPYIQPHLVPPAEQVVYRNSVRKQQIEFLSNIPAYSAPPVQESTGAYYLGRTTTRMQPNITNVNVPHQREQSLRRPRKFTSLRYNLTLADLEEILPYKPQKARKFPAKHRTVEEQLRRDRNTIACRKSRRLKRLNTTLLK